LESYIHSLKIVDELLRFQVPLLPIDALLRELLDESAVLQVLFAQYKFIRLGLPFGLAELAVQ
jgi:hypothetical protein